MIRTVRNPDIEMRAALCKRPEIKRDALNKVVSDILRNVRKKGDEALLRYAREFDRVNLRSFKVNANALRASESEISAALKGAIRMAADNIRTFHAAQLSEPLRTETQPGVSCWQKRLPIERVGLYIPGGSAPLLSSVLMLAIPAVLAGCKEIILCTPPSEDGEVHPAIRYAASLCGITKVFKVGGAQAIAAMAFGTEEIPSVYKIFGPGNQYVTRAKELVQQYGCAVDMPAGPSELLVIAGRGSRASFVAADLLSQAEHGPDSQVVLLSPEPEFIEQVKLELSRQIRELPRKEIATKALTNSYSLVLPDLASCLDFSNQYAPEHLILAGEAADLCDEVLNAGSVFVGDYSCESAGDYASGTNHTLPTSGFARAYSGLSVESFTKLVTFQEISARGIQSIGKAIEIMAEAEALFGHKNAVTLRLREAENG